jgi:hypothetical protein
MSTATVPLARPVRPTDLPGSVHRAMNAVLLRSDRAFRQNRTLQAMMRQDTDILHAISVREGASSGLHWRLKPVDDDDLQHVARVDAMSNAIRKMPRFSQLRRDLAKAPWYGTAGVFLNYGTLKDAIQGYAEDQEARAAGAETVETAEAAVTIAPTSFTPLHADGIRFTAEGQPVLLISAASDIFPDKPRVATDGGRGIVIDDDLRPAFIFSSWNIDAPDPTDHYSGERVFAGHGLRSYLWDGWVRKQQLLQLADSYAERLSRGTVAVAHDGSQQGEAAAQSVVDSLGQSTAVLVPNTLAEAAGGLDKVLQVFEASGTGNQILRDMANDAAEALKLCILGQTLTTETAATGLGSGVADAHENTFAELIRFDTEVMDEALTRDLVGPMWRANFPDDPRVPEFISQNRETDDDPTDFIEMAERVVAMGVPVPHRDIRAKAGIREPNGDEPVTGSGGGAAPDVGDLGGRLADLGLV